MKKNLIIVPTNDMTYDEWLGYRKSGIGASEVGVILGLSSYKSSIELFYEKIGESTVYNTQTIYKFMGLFMEDPIATLWQHWEGSEESMMLNHANKKVIRRCRRIKAYVRNPKWPWLFVSLDRIINKHGDKDEGALELKTISFRESDKWDSGIPPSHVVQLQTQCAVSEFEYGELATLQDGRRFDVIPFEIMPSMVDMIIERTHDFWQRVEKARILINQRFEYEHSFNQRAVEEIQAQIDQLEPPPDGSDAYKIFLAKKYNCPAPGELLGTDEMLEHARAQASIKIHLKEKQEECTLHENSLKRFLGDATVINFGQQGNVTWKQDVNGTRRFNNKVKVA